MQFLCTFQSFGNKSRFVHVTESEAEKVRARIFSTLFRKLCSFEKNLLKAYRDCTPSSIILTMMRNAISRRKFLKSFDVILILVVS